MRLTKRLIAGALVVAALVFAIRSFPLRGDSSVKPAAANWATDGTSERFVVHEWGTFTSFSGSDSVKLEFRPLVDADLPEFVLDRGRQAGTFNPYGKWDFRVLQRMETPVTYFYSDRVRQVSAHVEFPRGLLTEFYPPVAEMQPAFNAKIPDKVGQSALDWGNFWIIPESRLQVAAGDPGAASDLQQRVLSRILPRAEGHDHYAYARETDAALVSVERSKDKQRPFAPAGVFFEKFLFYRGIGNFDLPLQLTAHSDGQFQLRNTGSQAIRGLFLVTVAGNELQFTKYDQIRPGEKLTLAQSSRISSADELAKEVTKALVAEQLYEKEALAMVKTWCSSWFGEQGTRLFYLLPQSATDELLPLAITPQPDEQVRVMVGRLEIMTPAEEKRITQLVETSARDRAASTAEHKDGSQPKPYVFPEGLTKLGRLAEPALVRVKNLAADPEIRYEAERLMAELRPVTIAPE